MSAHFKWYPSSEEVVVPWNARYSFPSQSNKATKITPRIPPKNGNTFTPGQVMRFEFPAQGYVNPINTTLEFDVVLAGGGGFNKGSFIRFQNNIQSLFNRVRLLYGATPLEDMINYNQIVRNLTEWTSTNQNNSIDQTSIAEGIGGVVVGNDNGTRMGLVNVRQNYIQGFDYIEATTPTNFTAGMGVGICPTKTNPIAGFVNPPNSNFCYRRYQVNLALGLLTQDKLIPTKWMASQLAIEITLAQPAECIYGNGVAADTTSVRESTYAVGNANLIPEILEFDSSYDAMFLKGLQTGGVPIKFSSWHTFIFTVGGQSNVNLLVQERSRSVKALFAVQQRNPQNIQSDSGATFFCTGATGNTMQNYQFRIGGRYFPAQPVQLSSSIGSTFPNGGCEAFVELQKALNTVGDYRLSSSVNTTRWAIPRTSTEVTIGAAFDGTYLPELDYCTSTTQWGVNKLSATQGAPLFQKVTDASNPGNSFAGNQGSCCYVSAVDLETSNGIEISGLNAEEQSDIAFIANWSSAQEAGFKMTIFSYYDAMLILRENNVLELIQ
jgi:hypothetical protein